MNKIIKTLTGFRSSATYEGSDFQGLYERLLTSQNPREFEDKDKLKLLKWAIIFCNQDYQEARKLGYRIVVRYASLFNDYLPLYDVALYEGFMPVAKFIEANFFDNNRTDERFLNSYISSYLDNFKDKASGKDIYLSLGQKRLVDFSASVESDSLVVAPTSYGKSEMIVSKVIQHSDERTCIIVPTKALLSQTKKRLLATTEVVEGYQRIITHPEMYKPDEKKFLAVLTQERLLRLMQQADDALIDNLMVDEAHSLLDGGNRAELLLQVIFILRKRNPKIKVHFFTPFLVDASSIETKYSNLSIQAARSNEFIKVQRYFLYNHNEDKKLSLYDQFTNSHIHMANLECDDLEFIHRSKALKNILYANKPRDIEDVAQRILPLCEDVDLSEGANGEFQYAYKAISEYLDPEYNLLKCIKKGVVYHHGRVPEIIRLYVEQIFSKHQGFQFIATTSTLLEGVNIPAEKIFLLSVKKGRSHLSKSDFQNLTGRICRFSEVFAKNHGRLNMLEPEIYIINGRYASKNFNPYSFLEKKAKITPNDKDEVNNILLKNPETKEEREQERHALEYVENIEAGSVDIGGRTDIRYVNSDVAKSCFKNNIYEFDIHQFESELEIKHEAIKEKGVIDDVHALMEAIVEIFIDIVDREDNKKRADHYDLTRLRNPAAQNFYSFLLEWRMKGSSYKKLISDFTWYWKEKEKQGDYKVYVGATWGEVKRNEDDFVNRYIDLRTKNKSQRVNLAILRIKDEQDFIEFNILKYVEILNDLSLLEESFYENIKYGSSDKRIICMLKNGFSLELAKVLIDSIYGEYISFDLGKDEVTIKKEAISVMEDNDENKVLIFELGFHI